MPFNLGLARKAMRDNGVPPDQVDATIAPQLSKRLGFKLDVAYGVGLTPTQVVEALSASASHTGASGTFPKPFRDMTQEEQAAAQTIEANPWVNPLEAAIAGFVPTTYIGKGTGIIATGLKGTIAGTLNAVMDTPIGVIVDEIDKVDSSYALPVAIGLGMLSSKVVETPLENKLLKGLRKFTDVKTSRLLVDITKGIRSDVINTDYNKTVRQWIGAEDWQKAVSDVQMQGFKSAIKDTIDVPQQGVIKRIFKGTIQDTPRESLIDQAIQVHIDLKNNPEHLNRFFNDLTPHQQDIVRLSQNLNPRQLEIASQIEEQYARFLTYANDSGVNINSIDNYVNRVWKLRKSNRFNDESMRKFGTSTKHSKRRTLDTILEGWARKDADGSPLLDLREPGATRSLNIYQQEISNAVNNKKFIDDLMHMVTLDGQGLLSTKRLPGYVSVDHPNFRKWRGVGQQKVNVITENLRGIRKLVTEDVTRGAKGAEKTSKPMQAMERVVKEAITSRGFTEGEADNMILRIKTVGSSDEAETIIKTIEKTVTEKEVVKGITREEFKSVDTFINTDGIVFKRAQLYAHPSVAKNLNNMMGVSALKGNKYWDAVTSLAATTKSWKLLSSFFHHIAYMGSYMLGGKPGVGVMQDIQSGKGFFRSVNENLNPVAAYKSGLRSLKKAGDSYIDTISEMTPEAVRKAGATAINDIEPLIELLIKNQTTIGRVQDWEEAILRNEDGVIRNFMRKNKVSGYVADSVIALREAHTDFMFQQFGKGLKIKAAMIELKSLLKSNPDMDPNDAARMVAMLSNADFGGLHLKAMGRNPTVQHLARILALAPDWTESNLRTIIGMFAKGKEGQLYQRFWARAIGKTMFASLILNAILTGGDEKELSKVYGTAIQDGNLRVADVNITPLYKVFGGREPVRKYFRLAGQFKDPFLWANRPVRSTVYYKSSIVAQTMIDFFSERDWQGRQFTRINELARTGETVRPPNTFGLPRPGISSIPSFILNKIKDAGLPIPVYNLFQWWAGEMDGFDATLKNIGGRIDQEPFKSVRARNKDKILRKRLKVMYPRRPRRQ
jgi:hypothetical protein